MKKTLNDNQFAKSNATIVSASPFRAVLRRKDTYEPDDNSIEDGRAASP